MIAWKSLYYKSLPYIKLGNEHFLIMKYNVNMKYCNKYNMNYCSIVNANHNIKMAYLEGLKK